MFKSIQVIYVSHFTFMLIYADIPGVMKLRSTRTDGRTDGQTYKPKT